MALIPKAQEKLLRFVFLTGISKFSQLSVFSELNNLNILTFKGYLRHHGGRTVHAAAEQILKKDYAVRFAADPRPVFAVGLNISQDCRTIESYEVVAVDNGTVARSH